VSAITSTADVAARLADARARRTPLRIAGAGTWLDAGRPCGPAERVNLDALRGIVEYEPGDLTLTARAGTSLAEIERVTAGHGQWLPLDAFGDVGGTLGATVATASSGPLATAFGTPRNQVLGCEVVTGAGEVIRVGGRVVKNVAGFDVTRLMTGAWGTLGVITEVSVRLRAKPAVDETIAVPLPPDGAAHAQRWLRASPLPAMAAELVSPALAKRLGIAAPNAPVLLLRFGGNETFVRAARHAVTALGDSLPAPATVWSALRGVDGGGTCTFRLSGAPARLAELWTATTRVIQDAGALAHATVSRGVIRCVLPAMPDDALRTLLGALPPATRIMERAPASCWDPQPADRATASLADGVRRVFDPDGLLNPGILGIT